MSFFNDVKNTVGDFVSYVGEVKDIAAQAVNDGVNDLADVVRNRRKANVVVVNETGGAVRNVHIKHKYSSNFRSAGTWAALEHAGTSSPALVVEHATGTITTGRDWWFICWTDAAGNLIHNGGGPGLGLVTLAENVILTVGSAFSGGAASAVKVAGIIGEDVENYNAHTLSDESGRRDIRIVLKPDCVLFDSPGVADETFSLVKVPSHIWKGWNPKFEKVWNLGGPELSMRLYSGEYGFM